MRKMKDIREDAEKMIEAGVGNREKLFAALPVLIELQDAHNAANRNLREVKDLVKELAALCSAYARAHQSIFDEGLIEIRDGSLAGDLTIDDITYRFNEKEGAPKRKDGSSLTQSFLAGLPETLRKSELTLNATKASAEELDNAGLYRPVEGAWRLK